MKPQTCECGVTEGQLHKFGCRRELCPFCEATMAENCGCVYDVLGIRRRSNPPRSDWLPPDIYTGGLTPDLDERWREAMQQRGRVPFVAAPQMCGRCGTLWPAFFLVPDVVWEYYAGPAQRKSLLCGGCFDDVRQMIDANQPRPVWLPDEATIRRFSAAWAAGDRATLKEIEPEKFPPNRKFIRPCRIGAPRER